MRRSIVVTLALALVAVACSPSEGAGPAPTPTPSTDAPTVPDASDPTGLGDDPLRAQLDWFVRAMNGSPMSEEVYVERFAEIFRAQVPYEEQFLPALQQLNAVQGDWLLVQVDEVGPASAVATAAAGDQRVRVSLEIDPDNDNLITGLLVQPADLPSTPDSFENAIGRLEALGRLGFLAAEVVDGLCVPVEEVDAGSPLPIGSEFKLYVLGALGLAIEAGDVAWDDELVIRDELKSIPTGVLQDEPDGTVKTVEEVASLMISISDNTATDHLIDLLGRERVEASMSELGLTTPELNIPLPTTREFAALKVGPAAGLRGQYIEADEAGRRAILDQISGLRAADIPILELSEPIDPDTVEWFSSATDICQTLAILWDLGSRPGLEPIREILTGNPGVAPEPGLWDAVAFKGGSEPGVMAMAWLMERNDGRTFALTGSILNTEETIDELSAALIFAGARDLLADQP